MLPQVLVKSVTLVFAQLFHGMHLILNRPRDVGTRRNGILRHEEKTTFSEVKILASAVKDEGEEHVEKVACAMIRWIKSPRSSISKVTSIL